MYHLGHLRLLILAAATILPGAVSAHALKLNPNDTPTAVQEAQPNGLTTIKLRWGARPGVLRYRLQVASDREFRDIVFDRVVNGTEYQISDISPGKYFWRFAPLTTKLGEFSSAAQIEVTPVTGKSIKSSVDSSKPSQTSVVARGGWRAAVGEVVRPVLAHLRSRDRLDLVGVTSTGFTFALDANSGVSLWSTRRATPDANPARTGLTALAPVTVKSASGLDDVIIISGVTVTRNEGATGRELWRATLPANIATATVLPEKSGAEVFLIDNSLQTLFILDSKTGNVSGQIKLQRRIVGAPVAFEDHGIARMMFAFDDGRVEVRDSAGAIVRSGDTGSPATTPPLFVRSSRVDLILVGTRSGLTALNADDLRPLGRVSLNGDAPRGTLAAEDLNGDGTLEVIMITDRGKVQAVNAADGKLIWETPGGSDAEAVAFADINGDGVLDVLIAGGQTFALAFSGRDGSIIWQDSEANTSVANHSVSAPARRVLTIRSGAGVLLIAGDSSRTGLRAVELSRRTVRQ